MTHPHQTTPTHPLLGLGQVPAYPVQEAGAGARSLVNMVLDRKDNTWLQVDITISGNIYTIYTCPQLDVCTTWRDTRRCDHGDLCCLAHPPPGIEILER